LYSHRSLLVVADPRRSSHLRAVYRKLLVEPGYRGATGDRVAVVGDGVDRVDDRAAFGAAVVGALDEPVLDAVAGDDGVVAAAAEVAVDAGLAEQHVGAGVADEDVV